MATAGDELECQRDFDLEILTEAEWITIDKTAPYYDETVGNCDS